MTAEPTVLIVAAKCGSCGATNEDEKPPIVYGPVDKLVAAFPREIPESRLRWNWGCFQCGGTPTLLLSQALPGEEGEA